MIFLYLYLGKFIAKSVSKFNWLSIPWTQIAPIFSAVSALAACASVIVAVIIATKSRKISEESNRISVAANKQNNFDNIFFKLLDLLSTNRKDIPMMSIINFGFADILDSIKQTLEFTERNKKYKNLLIYIHKNKEVLFEELVETENFELKQIIENNGKNIADSNKIRPSKYNKTIIFTNELLDYAYELEKDSTDISHTFAEVLCVKLDKIADENLSFEERTLHMNDLWKSLKSIEEFYTDNQSIVKNFNSFLDNLNAVFNEPVEITHEEIADVVEKEFSEIDFGSFFSLVNRIAKLIKEQYVDDIKKQNKYVGILRTQIPKELLVCVYYNSEYLPEGKKLQDNLKDLELWGSKDELKHNIHINANMFYNAEKEIDNIIENYTRK